MQETCFETFLEARIGRVSALLDHSRRISNLGKLRFFYSMASEDPQNVLDVILPRMPLWTRRRVRCYPDGSLLRMNHIYHMEHVLRAHILKARLKNYTSGEGEDDQY